MYRIRNNLVLGFHGCDESVRDDIINRRKPFLPSKNNYDWLGNGMYFWENNYTRAYDWAVEAKKSPQNTKQAIEKPSVLGAIISLGYCLDLLESDGIQELKASYSVLEADCQRRNEALVQNRACKGSDETLLRVLDCAVIEMLHKMREKIEEKPYDSVRAVFFEGNVAYPTAGFREKNHIQLCIRNPNCIKGFFIPLDNNTSYPRV